MPAALILSYLLGSIPTGYIAGRVLKGIDIRRHGSGNVGATNVLRVLGRAPGSVVLLVDVLKGVVPVTLVADALGVDGVVGRILLGLAAVTGHNWTVFLKFRGGKGVATSLGALTGLAAALPGLRPVLLACLVVWAAVFIPTGYVSLASLCAAVTLPVMMALTGQTAGTVAVGAVFGLFIVLRHRANIGRLAAGNENRVRTPFWKSPSPPKS